MTERPVFLPLPKPAPIQGTWWKCFICGSVDLCPHREPELVIWMKR